MTNEESVRKVGPRSIEIQLPREVSAGRVLESLFGKIDEKTAAETRFVVLNFADTIYINSSGVGSISGLFRSIHRFGGRILLVSMGDHVHRILEQMGFLKIMPAFPTLDKAVVWIKAHEESTVRGDEAGR